MRVVADEHFSLRYSETVSVCPACTVSVSAKAVPSAVGRNLLKRRCRAAIASALECGVPPRVYILQVKKGASGLSYAALVAIVSGLFARVA